MPTHSGCYRTGLTWTKWRRPGLGGTKVAPEETLPALTDDGAKEVRACSFDILPVIMGDCHKNLKQIAEIPSPAT